MLQTKEWLCIIKNVEFRCSWCYGWIIVNILSAKGMTWWTVSSNNLTRIYNVKEVAVLGLPGRLQDRGMWVFIIPVILMRVILVQVIIRIWMLIKGMHVWIFILSTTAIDIFIFIFSQISNCDSLSNIAFSLENGFCLLVYISLHICTQLFLNAIEEFLGMTSNLGTRPCTDMLLYLLPIPSK